MPPAGWWGLMEPKQKQLYKVFQAGGRCFPVYLEYDPQLGKSYPAYPDFAEHPEYTAEGRPFINIQHDAQNAAIKHLEHDRQGLLAKKQLACHSQALELASFINNVVKIFFIRMICDIADLYGCITFFYK